MRTNTGIFKSLNLDSTAEEYANAGFHNSIYREKNITSYLTDGSLWTRISSGKFDDLFVGDYFYVTLNNKTALMRIAGFDTFLRISSFEVTPHHAVIIPDVILETAPIDSASGIAKGYTATTIYTTVLPKWASYLETALGESHVLESREYLTSNIDANTKNCIRPNLTGASNSCTWSNQKANLLSETEICGYTLASSSGYENGMLNYGQLPLFRLNPQKIIALDSNGDRVNYWLRNIAFNGNYCYVGKYGSVDYAAESSSGVYYVRPRFIIG